LFSIDLRSLALFRIAVAVIFLSDLVFLRFPEFDAFYVDDGMFSLENAHNWLKGTGGWSLCLLDGSRAYQTCMLALAAAFSVGLLLGWQTRWMTAGCWVMAVSIANRNPIVCNYGDTMLQVFLFWSMFLPLGARWSLDARRNLHGKHAPSSLRVCSPGSAAALLQLSFVYLFTAIWKWNSDWLEGTAAETALQLEYARRAPWLDAFISEPFLEPLAIATLALELLGPLVIWSPWRTSFFRSVTIISFFLLHFSIELLFTPVLLSYICVAAWMLFLPSGFWDSLRIRRLLREPSQHASSMPVTAAPSTAMSRYRRRLVNGVCFACLFFVLLWNLATLPSRKFEFLIPQDVRWIGHLTKLAQTWDMFYRPSRHNGWHKARARLADGSVVDVLRDGEPFAADLLESNWGYHPSSRWKLFFRRLGTWHQLASLGDPVADYLRNRWNARQPESREAVELHLLYYERLNDSFGQGFTVRTCGSSETTSEPDWESLFDPLDQLLPGGEIIEPIERQRS
jgi:hypothetical protein